jgi:phosphotransacetylase
MREEKCTWRVEIAKLMISIGQDDLALEHLQAVVRDMPTANFTSVDPKVFEENLENMMKELKERIELRDSIGQKLQDNMESTSTKIALVAVGLAAIAGTVWMVRRYRNRS